MCCADLRLPFLDAEGRLQVLCFSSVLLQSGQALRLSLPSWAGSRASCIPVAAVLVVLSSVHRRVPLPLGSGVVLLYLVTWGCLCFCAALPPVPAALLVLTAMAMPARSLAWLL